MAAARVRFRELEPGDEPLLARVADGVFDGPVVPDLLGEFLQDRRHHMVVAIDGETVVGMVSSIHYIHPDKRPEMWINELGVGSEFRRRGIATKLIEAMLEVADRLECTGVWLATEADNVAARGVYESMHARREDATVYYFDKP